MLWIIAAGLITVGAVLYTIAKVRAAKKVFGGETNLFGDMFGGMGDAASEFAASSTPSDAIGSGLRGMGKMAKNMQQVQKETSRKLRLENFLYITGRIFMTVGVIILIVKILIAIFS